MNNMRFVNQKSKKKPNNKGFYTALGICLLAILVAAVMTYSDISSVFSPNKSENSSTVSSDSDTSENVSNNQDISHTSESATTQNSNAKLANAEPDSQNNNDTEESQDETSNEENNPPQATSYVYPATSSILKEFSNGNPVYSVTLNDWRVHDGSDFIADKGSMVHSITNGTVKEIYTDQSLGKTIVIDHGDFEAYYSGLGETTLVNPGDTVDSAQDIGSIKSVPCEISEQDHLHLAIKKDGVFINPMTILDGASEKDTSSESE